MVDVDVIPHVEEGVHLVGPERIPDALLPGRIARSSRKADRQLDGVPLGRIGAKGAVRKKRASIDGHAVPILRVGLQTGKLNRSRIVRRRLCTTRELLFPVALPDLPYVDRCVGRPIGAHPHRRAGGRDLPQLQTVDQPVVPATNVVRKGLALVQRFDQRPRPGHEPLHRQPALDGCPNIVHGLLDLSLVRVGNRQPVPGFEVFGIMAQILLEIVDRSLGHAILYAGDPVPILLFILLVPRRSIVVRVDGLRLQSDLDLGLALVGHPLPPVPKKRKDEGGVVRLDLRAVSHKPRYVDLERSLPVCNCATSDARDRNANSRNGLARFRVDHPSGHDVFRRSIVLGRPISRLRLAPRVPQPVLGGSILDRRTPVPIRLLVRLVLRLGNAGGGEPEGHAQHAGHFHQTAPRSATFEPGTEKRMHNKRE